MSVSLNFPPFLLLFRMGALIAKQFFVLLFAAVQGSCATESSSKLATACELLSDTLSSFPDLLTDDRLNTLEVTTKLLKDRLIASDKLEETITVIAQASEKTAVWESKDRLTEFGNVIKTLNTRTDVKPKIAPILRTVLAEASKAGSVPAWIRKAFAKIDDTDAAASDDERIPDDLLLVSSSVKKNQTRCELHLRRMGCNLDLTS